MAMERNPCCLMPISVSGTSRNASREPKRLTSFVISGMKPLTNLFATASPCSLCQQWSLPVSV